MRNRSLLLIIGGLLLVAVQTSWWNIISPAASFNLPLVTLLLVAPFTRTRTIMILWASIGLALDYTSALPFGSYLLTLGATVVLILQLARRFPLATNRPLHMAAAGLGSVVAFTLLTGVSWIAQWLGLGPWVIQRSLPTVLVALVNFLCINLVLLLVLLLVGRVLRRSLRGRVVVPHAAA